MSNIPKKIQDPTEAALSAIQEALNLRDQPAEGAAKPASEPEQAEGPPFQHDRRRRSRAAPSLDEEIFVADVAARPAQPGEDMPLERRAANDDRQSVGQILQALQRRPRVPPCSARLAFPSSG